MSKVDDESVDLSLSSSDEEDDDAKLQSPPPKPQPKANRDNIPKPTEKPKPTTMTRKQRKSVANVKWEKHGPVIMSYATTDAKTFTPRMVTLYGRDNWALYKKTLYLFGREVVFDKKRKHEIINREEEAFGGETKAFSRVRDMFIGISRGDIERFFRGSERRQLKARYQKQKQGATYIRGGRPGQLQIDLTFYRNQKLPVFGAVDVFSRYCFYQRVPDKRASSVAKMLKVCVEHFEKVSNFPVTKVSTDSGVEFQKEFKEYLKRRKIYYDRQVRSRKLIESLNRSLRIYVERSGWDIVKDLDELVAKFVSSYNASVHSSTKKKPNELIAISKEDVKEEEKRQTADKRGKLNKSKGFTMAKLVKGDRVRIYDPRRTEIKAKQKNQLKGKIKLSAADYVKKFTSHHRGQAPHWTKEIFVIERVMTGKTVERYLVEGKSGAFFRHELQKVAKVTKEDSRKKVREKRKQVEAAVKQAAPDAIRKAKFIGRTYIVKYKEEDAPRVEDPVLVLDVYKNYAIIWHYKVTKEVSYVERSEIVRNTRNGAKLTDFNGWSFAQWVEEFDEQIQRTKKDINETIQEMKDKAADPDYVPD